MIKTSDLSFSYGKRKIIDGIELSFSEGELCALLGKNGAGKTTLLRLLAGLECPCGGKICLDGRDYSSYRARDFAKRVGFFAQTRPIPQMRVFDYVAYGRYPHTDILFRLSKEDRRAIEEALASTSMQSFEERGLETLSGGEQRLVYLAQLIAQGATHLLLDEPTAFADAKNSFIITDILREQTRKGKCAVAVMHDIPLALSCFDRVIVLHEGKIIADAAPDEAVRSGAIGRAFGVGCEKTEHGYVLKKL